MITIREVAEKAGVSSTTVSHVINTTRFVSEETRQRVLSAMQELGYRPNYLARSLRRGETHTIGLILPDSSNPFFAEIAHSIEEVAFRQGYSLILCNTEGDLEKERRYVEVLSKKQVDGMIFVAAGEQTDSLQELLRLRTPLVIVDRDLSEHLDVDTVLTDNRQGGYQATRHLIDLGHQRIACITGPSNLTPSAERVSGYTGALAEAGLPVDEQLILRGDFHPRSGGEATLHLLGMQVPPTAIFTCNDLMAIGALSAANEAGYPVPARLAVVGFDDIELASHTTPPLSTIAQPRAEISQTAINLLLERINEHSQPTQRILLPGKLVIRASCGGRR